MVADSHAAYHNKQWWQASYDCQHRWPWMTLNPKNIDFKWYFGDFWLQKSELRQNGWRQTKITCEQELPYALARLMSISSDFLLIWVPFQMCQFILLHVVHYALHSFPRWQQRCCHASYELCSDYLLLVIIVLTQCDCQRVGWNFL